LEAVTAAASNDDIGPLGIWSDTASPRDCRGGSCDVAAESRKEAFRFDDGRRIPDVRVMVNEDSDDDNDDDDKRCGVGRGLYPRFVGEDNVCNESVIESQLYIEIEVATGTGWTVTFLETLEGGTSKMFNSETNR
jgi:hypothetical protein